MGNPFKKMHRRTWLIVLAVLTLSIGIYGAYYPLPDEIGMNGQTYLVSDDSVVFLSDETYLTPEGERVSEQTIFDEVFQMIKGAEHYILIDMFLWNSFQGSKPETHRALSEELAQTLVEKKQAKPDIHITVISDPINTVYDGQHSPEFDLLRENGIQVILTDLTKLRDSNPTYSMLWRTFLQWPNNLHSAILGKPYTFRWLPNVMDSGGEKITLRAYLTLFNFKANHRKLIVADERVNGELHMATLVTSANPHNGSSAHSNVAIRVRDGVWRDVVQSERAVAHFSGSEIVPAPNENEIVETTGTTSVALRTERAILTQALSMIEGTKEGDRIELAMFYLSEPHIIDSLIEASNRGAEVRMILDANKDAFGLEKNGVPNRPVAHKLLKESEEKIQIRWCATHGEQCHTKLLLVSRDGAHELLLGSANYTRRNLDNVNLETNVWVSSETPSTAFLDASEYFERMWNNTEGRIYTTDYEVYRDEALYKRFQAWFMERTGLSTF